jgi:hypothetical protein
MVRHSKRGLQNKFAMEKDEQLRELFSGAPCWKPAGLDIAACGLFWVARALSALMRRLLRLVFGLSPVGYRYHPPTLGCVTNLHHHQRLHPLTSLLPPNSALRSHPSRRKLWINTRTTSKTVLRERSDEKMADSAGAPRPSSSVKLVWIPSGFACRDDIGC